MNTYYFGHYDSRGGLTAVLANNVQEAIHKYVTKAFCVDPNDDIYEDMCRNAIEEIMGTPPLQIIGNTIENLNKNYDYIYGDREIQAMALVQKELINDSQELDEFDLITEVWICNPDTTIAPSGFVLKSMGYFGEDAFGMHIIK